MNVIVVFCILMDLKINDRTANFIFDSNITIFIKMVNKITINDNFGINHYFYYSISADFFPDLSIDTIIKCNDENYDSEKNDY